MSNNIIKRGLGLLQSLITKGFGGIKVVGGSKGPLYEDYLKQFEQPQRKHSKQVIQVYGNKFFKRKLLYNLFGTKKIEQNKLFLLLGNKLVNIKYNIKIKGNLVIKENKDYLLIGNKRINESKEVGIYANKTVKVNETREVIGKRDITPILEALDLI